MLLFDLDETLIHVKRTGYGDDDDDDNSNEECFEPEVEIPVFDPNTGIHISASFSIRPYARRCLAFAN